MTYRDLILTATRGLLANKGRSMLTILGIIIGVAAIVLVMSLGAGAQDLIISQVQSVGGDTVIVRPGREPNNPNDAADAILSDSLKERDVIALSKTSNVPGISQVIPIVLVTGNVQYLDNFYHPTVLGWDAQAVGDIFKIYPEQGDFFTADDIRSHAPVAVIGSRVAEKLFDTESPIGKLIKLKNHSLRVVGVLPQRGQVSFFNLDELVIIPYTTAQQEIVGIDHYNELFIKIDDPQNASRIAEDVRATIREQHNITDPTKDDFFVVTQQDIVQRLSTITTILTIFLSSIAAISLLVGGIGIMNIMLVSVTERTREIGLRKALGATTGDILRQFLLEAAMLTTIGGLIGIAIAATIAALAALIIRSFDLDWQFSLPILSVILGIGMSGSIGVIFGLYPALKAARKSPIEALRWE